MARSDLRGSPIWLSALLSLSVELLVELDSAAMPPNKDVAGEGDAREDSALRLFDGPGSPGSLFGSTSSW